eukprot:scaffold30337_cov101-Isochrysis_galbana.AAC.1
MIVNKVRPMYINRCIRDAAAAERRLEGQRRERRGEREVTGKQSLHPKLTLRPGAVWNQFFFQSHVPAFTRPP